MNSYARRTLDGSSLRRSSCRAFRTVISGVRMSCMATRSSRSRWRRSASRRVVMSRTNETMNASPSISRRTAETRPITTPPAEVRLVVLDGAAPLQNVETRLILGTVHP
jgi:hypothetical protein